jgi:hypothetical protein
MNIFWLDKNLEKCAKYHCDKHVVKMCLEYAQILCSALHLNNYKKPEELYRLTHRNHPCVLWAAKSIHNWDYLMSLLVELNKEYKYRYNKKENHKSANKMFSLDSILIINTFGEKWEKNIKPPMCIEDDCKSNDLIESYRKYYLKYKLSFATWKNREKPFWVKNYLVKESLDEK